MRRHVSSHLDADVHVARDRPGLERGPERALDERREQNIRARNGVVLVQDHELVLALDVVSRGPHPAGGPPELEPEQAHEPYAAQLANRRHVATPGLAVGRVEAHEAAHSSAGW